MNTGLPTGTVTFLFTDIQGSTPLWEREPEKMAAALQVHNQALRQAIEGNGGVVFKVVGDAFNAAFPTAMQALKAAIEWQRALEAAPWNELGPLKVRMGIHTGEAELDPGGDEYAVSHTKNRVSRVMSAAYGGQVLLSAETHELCDHQLPQGVRLKDMGEHRLKGMSTLEHLYQACAPGLQEDFPPLASGITHPNNLPVQRTAFIGRQAQVIQVEELLEQVTLVTLTGSGGVGKTRLSLQVAHEVLERFPDGIWFLELAPVTNPALLVQTVAGVLGLQTEGSRTLHEVLLEYLRGKQALLVLDNCEHLIEACAALADDLMQNCQGLKILASSREALGVVGEMPFRVPSMTLPDPHHLSELTEMEACEAVRLFTERARASQTGFRVTEENAPAVAQVCLRLDGIPLAIELAAARLNVLTPAQLASRLDDAFRLLTGGARTSLPRQQTLRAAIDWSYQLLLDEERRMLRRLAVFTGSFDLEAVEAVCSMDENERVEALDLLGSLVRKSMLTTEQQPGQDARYRLLETVRQYAREKQFDAGESLHLHDLHMAYYLNIVEQYDSHKYSHDAAAWMRRLDVNMPNIRAALSWALDGDAVKIGISAVPILRMYWGMRNMLDEGRTWLEKALKRVDLRKPSSASARVLTALGVVDFVQDKFSDAYVHFSLSRGMGQELGDRGTYAHASMWLAMVTTQHDEKSIAWKLSVSYLEESTAIFRELGMEELQARCLWLWGLLARNHGELDRALSLLEESGRLWRKLNSWYIGSVQFHQASIYYLMGQPQQARSLFRQSLPPLRELGDQWSLMWALGFWGQMEVEEATDSAALLQAEAILQEGLEIARKYGSKNSHIAFILVHQAKASQNLGDYPLAISRLKEALLILLGLESNLRLHHLNLIHIALLGLAEASSNLDETAYSARLLGALAGLPQPEAGFWKPISPEAVVRSAAAVRAALGEQAYSRLVAEGKAMSLEQAVAYALGEPSIG